jgi:RES domain-containing protein
MPPQSGRRDSKLIDALDAKPRQRFQGTVWRVAREGRDPTQCSAPGGRWDDGTFDVLYTSLEKNGALAETHFHLMRGQPVFPSKLRFALHELSVSISDAVDLAALDDLAALGLDTKRYGQLAYEARTQEYPSSQQIAEAAHFLDFRAMIVSNARWNCRNLVIFCDSLASGDVAIAKDHGIIDWEGWREQHAMS